MRGLPQKQNARRADKIRLCGHLGRYKKIVKKTYIIYSKSLVDGRNDTMHTYSRGGMPAPAMMERSGADSVRRIDGGEICD